MGDSAIMQRKQALTKANEIRLGRAALWKGSQKREQDPLYMAQLLVDCPQAIWSMGIADFILHIKRYGRSKTLKLLSREGIHELRHIEHLSERQRLKLSRYIKGETNGENS